ncbi:hypothetical protein N0V82_006089 [Gnomoniopsis sp. IMI 355080]|nr:hypothetical protein N0V82_006089 [Gnomoniopsis sp. IMI 355080]
MKIFAPVIAALCIISGVSAQQLIPTNGTFFAPNIAGINQTYAIQEITWALEAQPHIPYHTFTGTVEQVFHHVSHNFPAYQWPGLDLETAVGVSHAPRDQSHPASGTVQCWRFAACALGNALSGITYLKGVPGQPIEGPGPGACARVSCGYDCGIWWCNDNPFGLILGGFNWIAEYANQIQQDCDYMGGSDTMTFGQAFHPTEDWNVILGRPAYVFAPTP